MKDVELFSDSFTWNLNKRTLHFTRVQKVRSSHDVKVYIFKCIEIYVKQFASYFIYLCLSVLNLLIPGT